ncbi:hypothetical protein D8I35_01485 [Corticibacter populi]|uniref:Zinc-dependent peptidase n=1 Tax=Corticibacter populi TaxID=1550736 RepID=A0A3M6QXT3_9BURK|nr:M90 family metallopeptidase [Corticibacter populi]RMX07827.1 hypothetical protein D8I35_01485 [Corticibacter populi]RZS35061.1 hypothetical protein EV687_0115 [Corticibacter populi]
MFRWLAGLGASRRAVARLEAAIPGALWRETVASMPFLAGLGAADEAELRRKAAWLLASKRFSGAHGLQVSDAMALAIAIQAALPILRLDTAWYEGWVGIIVYPGAFMVRHPVVDKNGLVHDGSHEADGEAWDGGPLILSWQAAAPTQDQGDVNVVIHEFAHKLDLRSGLADGMPGLTGSGIEPAHWQQVLAQAFEAFVEAVEAVEAAIPEHIDPDSIQADAWYGRLPLDPYAATDPAEFFAVSSEAFFVDPARLAFWQPAWYSLLVGFYRQNPLLRLDEAGANRFS